MEENKSIVLVDSANTNHQGCQPIINSIGWAYANYARVYCTGSRIICPSEVRCERSEELRNLHIRNNFRMETRDKMLTVWKDFISGRNTSVQFAALNVLMGYIRPMFRETGFRIPCVLNLIADRGSLLPEIVRAMSNYILDENDQPLTFVSMADEAAEKGITSLFSPCLKDVPYVISDIHWEGSSNASGIESTVMRFTHCVLNNMAVTVNRRKITVDVTPILISHRPFGSRVLQTEMLFVNDNECISESFAAYYTKMAPEFNSCLYLFLKYVSNRYELYVREYDDAVREWETDNFNYKTTNQEMFIQVLRFTYRMALEFYNHLSQAYETVNKLQDISKQLDLFDENAKKILDDNHRINKVQKQNEKTNMRNLSKAFLNMKDKNMFDDCKDEEYFKAGDYYFISTALFIECYRQKYGVTLSAKSITAYFRKKGILSTYDHDKGNIKHKKRRYLALDKKMLKKDAELSDTEAMYSKR